ncbi:MAG TPA: hypothetical protein VF933_04595, partial [Streptosporangiaceae bacterium]
GELVDAQGLAGPEQARRVVSDGTGAPVITDGPFPEAKELLAGHHRFHAVRGHLLEMAGDIPGAAAEFRAAAAGTANLRERHYLTLKAASLAASPAAGAG